MSIARKLSTPGQIIAHSLLFLNYSLYVNQPLISSLQRERFQMFRVLSNLVQFVGTCFLLVGLCFQIYSLNSNKWITWTTDANEGLSYFEGTILISPTKKRKRAKLGLWNRCTIQQNTPVLQWVCWKWTLSIAKETGSSPIATPIRF